MVLLTSWWAMLSPPKQPPPTGCAGCLTLVTRTPKKNDWTSSAVALPSLTPASPPLPEQRSTPAAVATGPAAAAPPFPA